MRTCIFQELSELPQIIFAKILTSMYYNVLTRLTDLRQNLVCSDNFDGWDEFHRVDDWRIVRVNPDQQPKPWVTLS